MRTMIARTCVILMEFVFTASLEAETKPLEVTVSDIDLPKLTVNVTNTSVSPVIVWERGMSWGDRSLRFEFSNGDDAPVFHVMLAPRDYTINFANGERIEPRRTKSWSLDLGKDSSGLPEWNLPYLLGFKSPGLRVRAVFSQRLDREAWLQRAFVGTSTSAWHDVATGKASGKASCFEDSPLPAPSRPGASEFPSAQFMAALNSLKVDLKDPESRLSSLLGRNLPWERAAAFDDNFSGSELQILLPNNFVLDLTWDENESMTDAERTQLRKELACMKTFGRGAIDFRWAPVAEIMDKLPARGLVRICLWRSPSSSEAWRLRKDGTYKKERR